VPRLFPDQHKQKTHAMLLRALILPIAVALLISVPASLAASVIIPSLIAMALGSVLAALVATILLYVRGVAPLAKGLHALHELLDSGNAQSTADIRLPAGCKADYEAISAAIHGHGQLGQQMSDNGSQIAIAAAEVSFAADQLKAKVQSQANEANNIAEASQRITQTVEEVAELSAQAAELAVNTRTITEEGRQAVSGAVSQMQRTSEQAGSTAQIIGELENKSRQVQNISSVISGIAEQTNLLALNAAIEAARAGEQGRGFAVVADEVRTLAQRTAEATNEIGTTIEQISDEISKAVTTMDTLLESVGTSREQTEFVGSVLSRIVSESENVEGQIGGIAGAAEANTAEVSQISSAVQTVSAHLESTEAELQGVADRSLSLAEMAETIHDTLADFPVEGVHGRMRRVVLETSARIGELFEDAIAKGRISEADLFDRNYQPIPDTNPEKVSTRFDKFTDEALPAIQEPILEIHPEVAYAGAVDDNGYFPTHNRKYAQPLTGDYEHDLVHNRTKRIFTDRTGSRCGSNTKPFLLQTYKRDTGEVMHDLSAPIYINGRHWGGFRLGYKAED
jgi:methyl-accepting chemotaxis protein